MMKIYIYGDIKTFEVEGKRISYWVNRSFADYRTLVPLIKMKDLVQEYKRSKHEQAATVSGVH